MAVRNIFHAGEKMQVKTYRPNKPEYVSIITLNKDDATASFENMDISIANKDIFTADICIYGDITVNQGVAVMVGG